MEDESLKWFTSRSYLLEYEEYRVKTKRRRANGGCLRLQPAKKDVVSCEKLRGAANRLRSADVRMGQPWRLKAASISRDMGQRRELKHLSTCRKRKKASMS